MSHYNNISFSAEGPELAAGQWWMNEDCYTLTVEEVDSETGIFTGTIRGPPHTVQGLFSVTGHKNTGGNTIAWTAKWENDGENHCSATAWTGQLYYSSPYGIEAIRATHITIGENQPVQVGFDNFVQDLPPTCEIPK